MAVRTPGLISMAITTLSYQQGSMPTERKPSRRSSWWAAVARSAREIEVIWYACSEGDGYSLVRPSRADSGWPCSIIAALRSAVQVVAVGAARMSHARRGAKLPARSPQFVHALRWTCPAKYAIILAPNQGPRTLLTMLQFKGRRRSAPIATGGLRHMSSLIPGACRTTQPIEGS